MKIRQKKGESTDLTKFQEGRVTVQFCTASCMSYELGCTSHLCFLGLNLLSCKAECGHSLSPKFQFFLPDFCQSCAPSLCKDFPSVVFLNEQLRHVVSYNTNEILVLI